MKDTPHRFFRRIFGLVVFGLAESAISGPVFAAEYFVATNGNDNSAGTEAAPFRNIGRAASLVAPGDRVTVRAGTYNETVTLARAGTPTAPIVFRSLSRGAARINGPVRILGSYLEFSGFDVTNPDLHGISLSGHHLTVRDNDVHDCQGNGITAFASDHLTIEGNRLFRNGRENSNQSSGIAIYQPLAVDQAPGYHLIIRRNESFDNESRDNVRRGDLTKSTGLLLEDFRNVQTGAPPYRAATLVENNLFYNNVGRAVVITGSDHIAVRHNTAWGNLRVRNTTATAATNGTFTCTDSEGVRWFNNLVVTRVEADLAVFEIRTTGGSWDYNVFAIGGMVLSNPTQAGFGRNNLFADPSLANPAAGDFRPTQGSIALDRGSAAETATADFSGNARPQGGAPDIGAFEVPASAQSGVGPPVFQQPLAGRSALAGGFTTFVAAAAGAPPLRYQWLRNGSAIAGATDAVLNFAPVTAGDGGSYSVTVSNGAGTATSAAASLNVASVPQFDWRAPLPKGGTLNGVAYGGGKFVAVGINGRVLTSTDGQAWTEVANLPASPLLAVAFDGFQWVTVGANGSIFTSRDAVNWIPRTAAITNWLRAVASVNQSWIAVGDGGTILTSFDGANWTTRPSGVTQNLWTVAGTPGRYVVGGQSGVLLTSPDTANWTRTTPAGFTGEVYAAGYQQGQFVVAGAGGTIFSSTDGASWTPRRDQNLGNWIRALAFGGSRYVFTTDTDTFYSTPDLASYVSVVAPPYNYTTPRFSIAYGAGRFVAVGSGGEISSSPDGQNWTAQGAIGARWANHSAAWGNGYWVVVGARGSIQTSRDGIAWERRIGPTGNWLRGVAFGAGQHVIVGDRWTVRSTDGANWIGQLLPVSTGNLNAVAFLRGRFVAVGNSGIISTSTDGANWVETSSGVTTTLRSVISFRGAFYAFGDTGVILKSGDGLTWAPVPSGVTAGLLSSGTDGQLLYAVGNFRTILASTDGQTWTPRPPPALNNGTYRGVAKVNGGWLVVGDAGDALFSLDGVTWSLLPVQAEAENLYALASQDGTTLAVGEGGTILHATDPARRAVAGAPTVALSVSSSQVLPGEGVVLAVDAQGTGPFTYQWQRNGAAIPGATRASFTFTAAADSSGRYSVTVTNTAGSTTSRIAAVSVTPRPEFEWRAPLPEGGSLFAVTYAGGRFVAVSTGSRVLVSNDGLAWTTTAVVPTAVLFGIATDGYQWVAVGNNGALFTSVDLVNWARRNAATVANLRAVAHLNGAFIACGDTGTIVRSSDGINWAAGSAGITQYLNCITGRPGAYVAAGQSGVLVTSPDALTWTRIPLVTAVGAAITTELFAALRVNEEFIVAGSNGVIQSSADGIAWRPRNTNANFNAIRGAAFDGQRYVFATDSDRVVVSPDLTAYTNITIPPHNLTAPRLALAHGAGLFVTVGYGGEISSSPDGVTWTRRGSSDARWANYGVTHGGNRWLVVGSNGGIFTSPDALTWTRHTSPTSNWLRGCTYGAGRYVAVGDGGWIVGSTDGQTWTGTLAASGTTQNLNGVAFTNGRFVAAGNNGIMVTSVNGVTWTPVSSGVSSHLLAVGAFGDKFHAVGNSGVVVGSTDGTSWRPLISGTTQTLYNVGGDRETAFIVGSGRTLLASNDGETWTPRTMPQLNNSNLRGIARLNGGWVIVGDQGVAWFSLDGYAWEPLATIGAAETMNAIAWNELGAVAVGTGGTVLHAPAKGFGLARLTNVATRGFVPAGGALTPGFVLRGSGSKRVVVRGVGPTLSAFGLGNALGDVQFDLVNQQTGAIAAANDNWGGGVGLTQAFAALGAFPLPADSKDAAVQASLPVNVGGYSIRVGPAEVSASGLVLAEVYDADDDNSPVQLANVSTLGFVGTEDNALTPGFVIRGSGAKRLLIRAVGPTLAQLGVGGVLLDPELAVFAAGASAPLARNDDWGGTPALQAAFAAAGAFALAADSKDAALIVTLPPGAYTVVTSGVRGATGMGLVEVYDLDP